MAVQFTTKLFPKKASLKEKSGLPWGLVFQPLVPPNKENLSSNNTTSSTLHRVPLSKVARCQTCYAYVNPFAKFSDKKWLCPLCHHFNSLKGLLRYSSPATRSQLPELKFACIEYVFDEEDEKNEDLELTPEDLLIVIAVVDATAPRFIQQEIANALSQALNVLPPTCLFGLVLYSAEMCVFDLRSPWPHLRRLMIPTPSSPLNTKFDNETTSLSRSSSIVPTLEDVAPLPHFLVPIANYYNNILRALESLTLLTTFQQETTEKRGFGYTIQSLIEYLSNYEEALNVRLLMFVSGPCNYGVGATVVLESAPPKKGLTNAIDGVLRDLNVELNELSSVTSTHRPSSSSSSLSTSDTTVTPTDVSSSQHFIADIPIQPQTEHYREWGLRAAEAGIVIDLFAFIPSDKHNNPSLGLASLKFLSTLTGGSVRLYTPENVAVLTQDVMKLLSGPQAYRGVLRLRTSHTFRVKTGYGPLRADTTQPDLFHLTHCNQYTTLCFDFEHVHTHGLITDDPQDIPTLQIAFAFAFLKPFDNSSSLKGRVRLYRRVIVHTLQVGVAYRPHELYESAQLDTVFTLLVHKVLRASLDEGIAEGRALLQDWLTIFLLRYNQILGSKSTEIDITLNRYPNLRDLPTLVFSFLKHPLLRPLSQHSADYWIFLQCLYTTSLSPSLLRLAFYPTLFALREGPCEDEIHEEHQHSPFLVRPWFSSLTPSLRVVYAAKAPLYFLDTLHTLHLFQIKFNSESSLTNTTTEKSSVIPTFNPVHTVEYTDLFTRSGHTPTTSSSTTATSQSIPSSSSGKSSTLMTMSSMSFIDITTVPVDEESKIMKLIRNIQRTRPITPSLIIHTPFEDRRGDGRLTTTTTTPSLNELLLEEENTAGKSLIQWLANLQSHLSQFYTQNE